MPSYIHRVSTLAHVAKLLSDRLHVEAIPNALFAKTRVMTNDETLRQIAALDYGHDAEAHFHALVHLRDGSRVEPELVSQPREVLELARWLLPQEPEERAMRLFACVVLIEGAADPTNRRNFIEENQSLAVLLESISSLKQPEFVRAALSVVLSRLARGVSTEDRPFFAFAVLLLVAMLTPAPLWAEDWKAISDWVIEEEAVSRKATGLASGLWLLGGTMYDRRHEIWARLAQRLLSSPSIPGTELIQLGIVEWSPVS